MKTLRLASAYKKDLKRIARRGYGWRECHIQSDWLLIYKATNTEVLLARTGTHADLFAR
jgi:mRNA-degrading endonuclease YafQ of YafQ-DinJ toxin-antitoxin module